MLSQILILTVIAAACHADYNEFSRPSYVTPSPSPAYSSSPSYHHATAEPKSYSDDERRPYSDGPSHPRTGPAPKKIGPGPGPGLSYTSGGVPLSYPQRLLPAGSIIGYLAYPQPLAPLHDTVPTTGLLPSAAFSHIAYAAPVPLQHYRPLHAAPTYNQGPSYSPGPSYSSYNH